LCNPKAILIGNSDGIGLAATKRLLNSGWKVSGVSRSESSITDKSYQHRVADVSEKDYPELLEEMVQKQTLDLCVYFVGIGELLDPANMNEEAKIIDVNLCGMVKTASAVLPGMVNRGQGHFIGISSLADELLSAEAPSYHASKAGFSNYLEGMAMAMKKKGVNVTNVRYGFVDTKMAKGDVKPFMMSVEKAVDHLEICIRKKPVRYTAPKIVIPLVKIRRMMMKLGG
jgi:short-subunit dehydrogenase